jgi:hypothetical protein
VSAKSDADDDDDDDDTLSDIVYNCAAPALFTALTEQGRSLDASLVKELGLDSDVNATGETAPATTAATAVSPSMRSEYVAASELLDSLTTSHVTPLECHSLAHEFLAMNAPVYANDPRKAKAAGVLALATMLNSLSRMPLDARPKRALSLAHTTAVATFDSLYPDPNMKDDESDASDFNIAENVEGRLEEEGDTDTDDDDDADDAARRGERDIDRETAVVMDLFMRLTKRCVGLATAVCERVGSEQVDGRFKLKTDMAVLGLLTHAFERAADDENQAELFALLTKHLQQAAHLDFINTLLQHPQRRAHFKALNDDEADLPSSEEEDATDDDGNDDDEDEDAPKDIPSMLQDLPFKASPRFSSLGIAKMACFHFLSPGGATAPLSPAYQWSLGWPHVEVLLREGESALEDEEEGYSDAGRGKALVDAGLELGRRLVDICPDGSVTDTRGLAKTLQLILNCMVNFKSAECRDLVGDALGKIAGDDRRRLEFVSGLVGACPFPLVKGALLSLARRGGLLSVEQRKELFLHYLNVDMLMKGMEGVEQWKEVYMETAVGMVDVIRETGDKSCVSDGAAFFIGELQERIAAGEDENAWRLGLLCDALERLLEESK